MGAARVPNRTSRGHGPHVISVSAQITHWTTDPPPQVPMDAVTDQLEDVASLRAIQEALSPSTVLPSPFDQFRAWLDDATNGSRKVMAPKDMSVATATARGVPSVRTLRLDAFDERGFVFCTSYRSRKSQELTENPRAALVFYWKESMESKRQVRVIGRAEKISDEESDLHFKSRPLVARIAVHAVHQSDVIGDLDMDSASAQVKRTYGVTDESEEDADIPRPESWGGWRVIPQCVLRGLMIRVLRLITIRCLREVEFWSGKPSRLHDRVRYLRDGEDWKIERLAP